MLTEQDLKLIDERLSTQKEEFLEGSAAQLRMSLEKIDAQFAALMEGQQAILAQLNRLNQLEKNQDRLEERTSVMESAVRLFSEDLAKLKKAQ